MVTIVNQIARYRRRAARIMFRFHQQNRTLTTRQAFRLAWLLAELRELRQMEQIHGPNAQVHPFERLAIVGLRGTVRMVFLIDISQK